MRIDNTDREVITHYELKFNLNDPGEIEPIDLCWDCSLEWSANLLIDNPDYTDGYYICFECGKRLDSLDNY